MPDTLTTQYPFGKEGITMDREIYDLIKDAMVSALEDAKALNFGELKRRTYNDVKDQVNGDTLEQIEAVKFDMETKGELSCKYRSGLEKIELIKE